MALGGEDDLDDSQDILEAQSKEECQNPIEQASDGGWVTYWTRNGAKEVRLKSIMIN